MKTLKIAIALVSALTTSASFAAVSPETMSRLSQELKSAYFTLSHENLGSVSLEKSSCEPSAKSVTELACRFHFERDVYAPNIAPYTAINVIKVKYLYLDGIPERVTKLSVKTEFQQHSLKK